METVEAPQANAEESSETTSQYLTFILAEEEYGVDILRVQEIKGWDTVTPIPNTPDYLKGVINLRGKIVPVIDLRCRFNLQPKEKDGNTRIIVVELSGKTVGFLVDRVQEVIRVETAIIEPPPDLVTNVQTRYITGVAKLEDRLLLLLDLNQVLKADEQEALALETNSA